MAGKLITKKEATTLRKAWLEWRQKVKKDEDFLGNNDLFTDSDALKVRLLDTILYLYSELEKAKKP